jgi:probable F420-dependent oxidoreductase
MQLSVDFASVLYREGGDAVSRVAREIESIGYDRIEVFDHVVMGHPTATRPAPIYPVNMPILEALMTLSWIASATSTIGLGTEVLILPQRQPILVARQIATLDTLSGGRVRLGVGVGWQKAEYEALGVAFNRRGRLMDDAIRLLRRCWADEAIDGEGDYPMERIAMEPKPPQGGALPIWVGGGSPQALRRVGELGDGWLASGWSDPVVVATAMSTIRRHAEEAGRDPGALGMQTMLDAPARDEAGRSFYQDPDRVAARALEAAELGFGAVSVNATAVFQSGARSVDALSEQLGVIHDRLRAAVG